MTNAAMEDPQDGDNGDLNVDGGEVPNAKAAAAAPTMPMEPSKSLLTAAEAGGSGMGLRSECGQ